MQAKFNKSNGNAKTSSGTRSYKCKKYSGIVANNIFIYYSDTAHFLRRKVSTLLFTLYFTT